MHDTILLFIVTCPHTLQGVLREACFLLVTLVGHCHIFHFLLSVILQYNHSNRLSSLLPTKHSIITEEALSYYKRKCWHLLLNNYNAKIENGLNQEGVGMYASVTICAISVPYKVALHWGGGGGGGGEATDSDTRVMQSVIRARTHIIIIAIILGE
ncbi:hypothetical protein ACJX0J_036328 [Zea mays]